jgi:hypothetical protein
MKIRISLLTTSIKLFKERGLSIRDSLRAVERVRDPPIQVNDYNYVPIFLITALSYSSLDFSYNFS